uniref:Methyltransferase n=1 Tax=Triticum urartu TaxID=4572 RepID=A0A8R7U5Q3_TRIUA
MALFDRNQRQRSSLFSTATVVVFAVLCLVGFWMVSPPSPEAVPAATVTASTADVKKAAEAVVKEKEEDRSIDATNNFKQDSANVVAEATTAAVEAEKPTVDAKGGEADGEKPASKNQSFDDENGRTEGGELVKPETAETDGAAAAAAAVAASQGKSVEDTVTDVKEQASTDTKETAGSGGQDANTEKSPADTKESIVSQEENPKEAAGGGSSKKQTFDDENGKMEGVDVVKDDGNKTFISEDNAKPIMEETTTAVTDKTEDAAAAVVSTEASAVTNPDDTKTSDVVEEEQKLLPETLENGQAELLMERAAQNGSFTTQAAESTNEQKTRAEKKKNKKKKKKAASKAEAEAEPEAAVSLPAHVWKLCNTSTGEDYIPCLDNEAAIKKLKTDIHYEHRERHCPAHPPTCLVPAPPSYKDPIRWPVSRSKIWYHNVPHTQLAEFKKRQNWVKVSGEYLTFPGGGTQFKTGGALHYIDLIQQAFPEVAWGRRSRVVLDVGCGVASFGGFMFERGVLTMSFAPKDEHEAQVQFALERGIPAISAVMGTKRLQFPSNVFDIVHCARCRVPWHINGGLLLLEVNRLVRPGGFFVWSATPVYQKLPEDVEIWGEMVKLTKAMCWEMVAKTRDTIDRVGLVHLPEADEQPLLRDTAADGASAVPPVRRPQRGVEHLAAGVHAPRPHRPVGARVAVAAAVAGAGGEGALLAEQQPGGRVREGGARGLRGGLRALEEGGPELVPGRHGHRLEERPERDGHAGRVRRAGGGAAGHERVGDEHGEHRLAGHAAGDLRAGHVRDIPRLVRVLQHLPSLLRPPPRRPPLLQAQGQV